LLLRRLTAHVNAQDWTAVAIDFAIVVIGVFVGIQVSNWNEARATSRRAAIFDELISTGSIGLIRDRELLRTGVRAYSITTGKHCGDRYIEPGDFKGIAEILDYPCETGLPDAVVDAAAATLRSDPRTLQYLRVRIADLETRQVELTSNNRDVFEGLQDIAGARP
jgi:hypothetical protein